MLQTNLGALSYLLPRWPLEIPQSFHFCFGVEDLTEEVFGPVLHLATFEANEIDKIIAAINYTGYGLTFGLHSRIDARVQKL